MDDYIRISNLNDFLFCPKSIYFHELYSTTNDRVYKDTPQVNGTLAHTTVDEKTYTTATSVLMGLPVYSDQYKLAGKIDTFDTKTGVLLERKAKIKQVYQGHIYQLYGQYVCLTEMGYSVQTMKIHSMEDNIVYPVAVPDSEQLAEFAAFLESVRTFNPLDPHFTQNPAKCARCIYRELCDSYAGESMTVTARDKAV